MFYFFFINKVYNCLEERVAGRKKIKFFPNQVWKNANVPNVSLSSTTKVLRFLPSKKLGQMITTVITHASGLPSFSPIQAKLYPIVKMGQWSLWVAMWYVQDTSGSETHTSNCSGIQICQPRHPTPIFSPTATPVLSEKIPTVILFSCHLCLHLPLAMYH